MSALGNNLERATRGSSKTLHARFAVAAMAASLMIAGCSASRRSPANWCMIIPDRSSPCVEFRFENWNWDTMAWADSMSSALHRHWEMPAAYTAGTLAGDVEMSFELAANGAITQIKGLKCNADSPLTVAALQCLMAVRDVAPAPGAGFKKTERVSLVFHYKSRVQSR